MKEHLLRTPDIDTRKYRLLTLDNSLDVLLISDPDTDRASAAVDVNVGYLSDPEEAPGLAHFLEHLLFLGTEKYPRENEYSQYLSDVGGGFSNAYTAAENTNFYFEVSSGTMSDGSSILEGALDRFAQFFTAPLFDESCTERELNAVDSEHKKNLQDDAWRIQQLEQDLSKEGHVYQKFGTGNLDTLKTIPELKGLKTREMCIKFYKKHYSANIMKLGKESLEELQTWAETKFNNIENKNLIPREYADNPLGENELGKLVRIKPVRDDKTIVITFPWPDTYSVYKKAPNKYITHLIGHESEGSILSTLKKLGLASSLTCYQSHGAKGFDFLKIEITISDLGLERWENVVVTVFQYMQMLKDVEVSRWIFDELAIMSELSFKYQEKFDASSYCSSLAQSMHVYEKPDILSGGYLMQEFDPVLIKGMMDSLTIDSFRIFLVSPETETDGWSTAPWYGTEFNVEPLPNTLIASLRNIEKNSNLHLPPANPFVPRKFDIIPATWTTDIFDEPKIIKDTPTTRSPIAYTSPRFAVLTSLYCELVMDALNEVLYQAEMADLNCELESTVEGLILAFGGYSDKLGRLVETVAKVMASLTIVQERFTVIKEDFMRDLVNFDNENPDHHASYFLTWLLQERLWTSNEKIQELESITADEVFGFYPMLLNPVHIEAFVHGTFDRQTSLELISTFETLLGNSKKIRPLAAYARFSTTRTHNLPANTNFTHRRILPNVENINNAVEVYLQFGDTTPENYTKALLLNQIISEPCFDVLRTKEQLGYVVWSNPRFATGICGLRVHVQSEKHPVHVESRIFAFLEEKVKDILDGLSEKEYARHQVTVSEQLLEKPKYMMEQTSYFWNEIQSETYDFSKKKENAEKVLKVAKAELVEFYESFVAARGPNRRKLSVQIWSVSAKKNAKDIVSDSLANITESKDEDGQVFTDETLIAEQRSKWTLGSGGFPSKFNSYYFAMNDNK
ncbi:hypothetical protein HK100_012638 [Physocladia obscura]|uniref:Insulysin n=1 Tax=Physocladia obscura TaxID=109957 RepID=A0AAD5XG43_9FUNG|nr:hypothetical protein HK100_012638 [Physocladia obscura]